MRLCPQCGTKLPEQAVFCPNCGDIPEILPGPPPIRENGKQAEDTALKGAFRGWWLILALPALLLAAAAIWMRGGAENGPFSPVPRPTAPASVAGSGYVGQGRYYVTVNGAERFTDLDGDSALRIYFVFTNENWNLSSVSASRALRLQASQDGKELELTYSIENEAVDAADLFIRPGVSLQCGASIKYKPDGGIVDLGVFGREEDKAGGVVSASYLPENLPGSPPPFRAAPVEAPEWTEELSYQGELGSYYVSIYDLVLIQDAGGNPAIRVFYAFSNRGTEEISMKGALRSMVYQDGIGLIPGHTEPEQEQDAAYYENVPPGETVLTSRVFRLRNTGSPVEAAVESEAGEKAEALGRVFEIC